MPREGQRGTGPDGNEYIFLDGAPRRLNSAGLAIMGEGVLKSPNGQTFMVGPQGGLKQVGGPTSEQTANAAKRAQALNNALQALDNYDQAFGSLKTVGPLGNITDSQRMQTAKTTARDLQMKMKDAYELGALTGPDWGIVQDVIPDPDTIGAGLQPQKIRPALSTVARTLGDAYRGQAQVFESSGGEASALPPLFRSPRSKYTPEQWGSQGRAPNIPPPPRAQAGAAQTKVVGGRMYYRNPQTGEWFDNKDFR